MLLSAKYVRTFQDKSGNAVELRPGRILQPQGRIQNLHYRGGGGGQVTNEAKGFSEALRTGRRRVGSVGMGHPPEDGFREGSFGKILNFGFYIKMVHFEFILR